MKKYLIMAVAAGSLALGGCASNSVPLSNSVTLNTLDGVVSLYGTTLSAARAYKSLPLCATGTVASVSNICAQRSIVVRLQTADAKAVSAITRANSFIKSYPTIDATNVISAASQAVSDLQSIVSSTGVH